MNKNIANELILCICISTYNRAEKVTMLVEEILKCKSSKLMVVVVDDKSTDNTIEKLNDIKDARLMVFQNAVNKGARLNWYETLNKAKGKYALQILDRDWVQHQYIDDVIEILEKEDVGFGFLGSIVSDGYIKNDNVYTKIKKGDEALKIWGGLQVHPSGFFIKFDTWRKIENKKRFFVEPQYGIYPHSYIYLNVAGKEDSIVLNYKMIKIIQDKYKSMFYKNNKYKFKFYWTPEALLFELKALTDYIYKESALPINLVQDILNCRFREAIYRATIYNREASLNASLARHYGIECEYVTTEKQVVNSLDFTKQYILYARSKACNICTLRFVNMISKSGLENIRDIFKRG